ncbi:hypothetical protein V8B97DRAFT_1956117 [Scleroderma yunnanense]
MGRGAASAEARGSETRMPCSRCIGEGKSDLCVPAEGRRARACHPCCKSRKGCSWVGMQRKTRASGSPCKRVKRNEDEEEDEVSRKDSLVKHLAAPWRRTGNQLDVLRELTGVLTRVAVVTEAIRDALLEKAETAGVCIGPEVAVPEMTRRLEELNISKVVVAEMRSEPEERSREKSVSETPEQAAGPSTSKGKGREKELTPRELRRVLRLGRNNLVGAQLCTMDRTYLMDKSLN